MSHSLRTGLLLLGGLLTGTTAYALSCIDPCEMNVRDLTVQAEVDSPDVVHPDGLPESAVVVYNAYGAPLELDLGDGVVLYFDWAPLDPSTAAGTTTPTEATR